MISYQLFTQTAVTTVIGYANILGPSISLWLTSRIDMLIFVYAFAWVFVLSSVIPSVILGKERSVLIQFLVCLTLTFMSLLVQDALISYLDRPIEELFNLAVLFRNPFLAAAYLLILYILMLTLDFRSRRRSKKMEIMEKVTEIYLNQEVTVEQNNQS